MYYITMKLPPFYHQMTLEDLYLGKCETEKNGLLNPNTTNTRTVAVQNIPLRLWVNVNIDYITDKLRQFNNATEELRRQERKDLYKEFYIPKHSGGLRKIDAPKDELKCALRALKEIIETNISVGNGRLYHTSAFAYIKGRSTIDAVKRHQANESKWFAKYDLTNFFGSVTPEFLFSALRKIYPFSVLMERRQAEKELCKALELAFLDNSLPQGTPISPLLTNIIMIPIDYTLANKLHDYEKQKYIYTRYADDFLVSSRYDFRFREIEQLIKDTLQEFNAPFILKPEKTRYGSSSGANWNLGVMLNKDNEITIGHKRKKQFQAMVANYVMDKKNGNPWSKEDVQTMEGLRSYYCMVEKDCINKIINNLSQKFNFNITENIKSDLRNL